MSQENKKHVLDSFCLSSIKHREEVLKDIEEGLVFPSESYVKQLKKEIEIFSTMNYFEAEKEIERLFGKQF